MSKATVFILLMYTLFIPSLSRVKLIQSSLHNVDFHWLVDKFSPRYSDSDKSSHSLSKSKAVVVSDTCFQTPAEYQSTYLYFVYRPSNMSNYERILEQLRNTSAVTSQSWNFKHFIIFPEEDALTETNLKKFLQSTISRILNLDKLQWNNQVYFISQSFNTINISISIWETYSFKNFTVTRKLTTFTARDEQTLSDQLASVMVTTGFTRNDFGGTEFLVLGGDDPDYQSELAYKPRVNNESLEFDSGLFVDLIWELEFMLNFTIRPVNGTGWISQDVNGSLTGIGYQILHGEGDISASFSQVAEYRLKYLYFLHPTFAGKDYSFFRQPEFTTNDKLLDPFQVNLWIGLGITWLIIVCSHIILLHVRKQFAGTGTNYFYELDLITLVAGITAQMGVWNWCKNCHTTRLVQFLGVLMCTILYMAYAATLVSHLTRIAVPVNTFNDLIRYNYIFLSTPRVSLIRFYVSAPEQADKLLEISKKYYVNESHAVSQVLSSPVPFAYINTLDTFFLYARANFLDNQICSAMSKVSSGQHRNKCGMFLPKNSQLKEVLNVKILISVERGMTSRSIQHYTIKETLNCENKGIILGPARLQEIYIACMILCIGIIISCISYTLEVCIFKVMKKTCIRSELKSYPRYVFSK